jgi:outer membrane protein OmpA-like peptidoglycan-associated protein
MVPGGQFVAGAVDKGLAAKAGKEAAAGAAAGAALSAATGKGNPCAGMGMMGNLGSAGMAQGVPGAGLPGLPNTGTVGASLTAGQIKQMEEQYRKMGMNPAQIKAMQQQMLAASPATATAAISAEQQKVLQAMMGMDPAQLKAMQGMSPATPGAVERPAAEAPPALVQPVAAPTLTMEKSRLVLRQLPWTPGSEEIQSGAESALVLTLHNAAAEIIPTAKHYTVQVKVEDQGSKARNQELAQKRAAVVVAVLVGEGVPQDRLTAAAGGSDKDPRVVLSESKGTK